MIKAGEIQTIAKRLNLRDTQIEKDYVIGWILKGISQNDFLKQKIIFKGGTALRKMYFSDYRLSEDLDFTYKDDDFDPKVIRTHFEEVSQFVLKEARIKTNIIDEKEYQTGNFNFYLQYVGPLGGSGGNKSIKVDIARDEILCNKPVEKNIYNEYSDLAGNDTLLIYDIGEIISEKMRSLMQRTVPRDLYDLWYLFENENFNIEDYIFTFLRKAKYKKIEPGTFVSTIRSKEDILRKAWDINLANQMQKVPGFDYVWRTLGKHWRKFEKNFND